MRANRSIIACGLACLIFVAADRPATAQAPLSIIDWLETEEALTPPNGPPVTETALQPEIDVRPLAAQDVPIGLVPSSVTGLPVDLWRNSDPAVIARKIRTAPVEGHPALQSLLYSLLLTEAMTADGDTSLLTARIDRLLSLGAIDPAKALIEIAGPTTNGETFTRWVDMSFLTGNEDDVCAILAAAPYMTPNRETLIFCVARRGDLNRATLLFDASQALGDLDDEIAPVLDRFLHPELFEDAAPLPQPRNPSPLTFRLFEAVGERLPTAPLPRRFAAADLRDVAGWKAQLEAAERLARTGAISSNTLLGFYTERLPAASGGVWDRVSALQRLETAIDTGSAGAVAKTLSDAWNHMRRAGLEVPFADLFAADVSQLNLDNSSARADALEMALLASDYASLSQNAQANSAQEVFWVSVAQGEPVRASATTALERAVADGFQTISEMPNMLDTDKLGEAILTAIALFDRGANGNLNDLTEALMIFRAVGLEDVARRAALHVLIRQEG